MIYVTSNGELKHFGIKGMRWGHRRFQYKDGSLTPAGKKRYDDDASTPKKSKHRQMLEEKYQKSYGLSKKEAEKAADNRIRTEKALSIIGGTAIAAAAAYTIRKKLKIKTDGLIKAGSSLQRVEFSPEGKLHDAFYVAKDRTDKTRYAGKLGFTRQLQFGKSYIMDIGVQKDIKIAGNDKARKTFENLYKNDSEFRKAASALAEKNVHGKNLAFGNAKKMYENFNTNLIDRDNAAVKKFYSTLKSEGYGAVRDINDMKFSGYKAKNPLIVFGGQNNVAVKSFREMTQQEAAKKYIQNGAKEAAVTLSKYATAGVTVGALKMYADDYLQDRPREQEVKTL